MRPPRSPPSPALPPPEDDDRPGSIARCSRGALLPLLNLLHLLVLLHLLIFLHLPLIFLLLLNLLLYLLHFTILLILILVSPETRLSAQVPAARSGVGLGALLLPALFLILPGLQG